jgi:hypothetical protein
MDTMRKPDTSFSWNRYADATLAGLAPLIPIPVLDLLVESFFLRRMPSRIAKSRHRRLSPDVVKILNQGEAGCLHGCLTLPFGALLELIKLVSRKLLYFLSVKQATDQISYYWHEAFLIDYMLAMGHLDRVETARAGRQAMRQVMHATTTSPLLQSAPYPEWFRKCRGSSKGLRPDSGVEQLFGLSGALSCPVRAGLCGHSPAPGGTDGHARLSMAFFYRLRRLATNSSYNNRMCSSGFWW